MSTKSEMITEGRNDAKQQAAAMMNDEFVRNNLDGAHMDAYAGAHASSWSAERKIRSTVYHDAFKAEFLAEFRRRRNDLPEIKAANRRDHIDRTLADWIDSAKRDLDKFAANFTQNPLNAFEYGGRGAIEAAGKLDVAMRLKHIVEFKDENDPARTEQYGGHENAVKHALNEALRGARWPSHSTSAVSNLAAEAKVAAFADFAASFSEKE